MLNIQIEFDRSSDAFELAELVDRVAGDLRDGFTRGYVRDVDGDVPGQVFIEFNELFLDNHKDEKNITPTGGTMIRADRLREGDVINNEPIFDYLERNGEKFDEADRMGAEAEFEVVDHAYRHAEHAYINMVGGETHVLPCYFEIEVTNA